MKLLEKIGKRGKQSVDYTFESTPHLLKFKPKERYVFHSDYFKVDDCYGCIMSFFHQEGATDNYGPFWGINRITSGLGEDVVTINFEQISRMGEAWINKYQTQSERVTNSNVDAQQQTGNNTSRKKASRAQEDMKMIAEELHDGAAYLNVHNRLFVKAPTLEKLDAAVTRIELLYKDRFGTLWCAPYHGDQRRELSNLFSKNSVKLGKGFYFTSPEFAGSYSLVTHGLEDRGGEYVGSMFGDVNNSSVLFDVDNYKRSIVVATDQFSYEYGYRERVSNLWGSKIGQAALLNNARVVHIVLNGCDLDKLGPKFDGITYRINMNSGDVNMFELFGDVKDELSIFPAQMKKLILMAEQACETTDADRSVIRGELEKIATEFYIDQNMWFENAEANRERLRLVGIPHQEVPKLETFVTYLDMRYKAVLNQSARDEEQVHALNVLSATFRNLLSSNGDLFNTITSDAIDGVTSGRRCVYDFSSLMRRGKGVAMAQLVNVIGFAIDNLSERDVVIIHGSEHIDKGVRDYINECFDRLIAKGGRVAYLYDSMNRMLDDDKFNDFYSADYTVYGNMSENLISRYESMLGIAIPPDLKRLVTLEDELLVYIRRGVDNVVFHRDLRLIPRDDYRR